jgi:hypothetical protein
MLQQEISELKEKIHELREYLYSDLCKACGEAALSLEKISQRLTELESQQNS